MPLPPLDVTAARAGYWHGGQTDKAGAPYVGHLIRVQAHLLRLFPDASEVERHAAWLHDVLEDTAITAHDLAEIGYPDDLIALVQSLSRPAKGSYSDWIADLVQSADTSAIRIKIADLTDNSDPERLAALPAHQSGPLAKRYIAAISQLRAAL